MSCGLTPDMLRRPLFSCVVPVKGDRPYLEAALASLRNQGAGDALEVIVQDGDQEADCGQSDALNRGFAKARGEWLFWLNADDVLLPGALARIAAQAADTAVSWIAGDEFFIDAAGRVVGASVGNGWHAWLYRHAVPHVHGPSSFFRRSLLERVGGLDTALDFCMDWDLWIRFVRAGACFRRVPAFLWAQRRWAGSKTQRALPPDELREQHREIAAMLERNGFVVTRAGTGALRIWRLLSGCYLREGLALRRWGRVIDVGGGGV